MNTEQLEDTLVDSINKDIPSTNLFNYDETPKEREFSEYCLGREGLARVKLDDFIMNHTWKLENYPNQDHKMYPCIKFIDFFDLGRHCIENNISQAKFCRDAILDKMDRDISKEKRAKHILEKIDDDSNND